jgi:hypothetical protein
MAGFSFLLRESHMKMITKSLAALAVLGMTASAVAEPVKVGMITTLSGGGASLGIDARDGFMLAIKNAGRTRMSRSSSRTTSASPTLRCRSPTR